MKALVSDHALLRYIERVGGIDIEDLRNEVAALVHTAANLHAKSVTLDGHVYELGYDASGQAIVKTVFPAGAMPEHLQKKIRRYGQNGVKKNRRSDSRWRVTGRRDRWIDVVED